MFDEIKGAPINKITLKIIEEIRTVIKEKIMIPRIFGELFFALYAATNRKTVCGRPSVPIITAILITA